MDLWTFIIIIVAINAFRDVIKKKHQTSQTKSTEKYLPQEIDDLKKRIENLENHSNIKRIEKRLQALETIVTDGDYCLERKFKKAFGEDTPSEKDFIGL